MIYKPTIKYTKGDATQPQGEGKKIITHICNNKGKWGKGFVLALSRRWSEPEAMYRSKKSYMIGEVQFVEVNENIVVANMIAQDDVMSDNNKTPIRYGALRICLSIVNDKAYRTGATIHMPKIGTGLAGGDWQIIEKIIQQTLASVDTTIYEL